MNAAATDLPLVYFCSGCPDATPMADALAARLQRENEAERSCIVGIAGNVPGLLRTLASGRPIVALDGCPLGCVRACLAQRGIRPDVYRMLARDSERQRHHDDVERAEVARIYRELRSRVRALRGAMD